MRHANPMTAPALALLAACALCAPAAAQFACQVPLFVQQGSIDANVMILMDNSGSMNEAVQHPDYDSGIIYPGNFNINNQYYIGGDGNYTPRSFSWSWPNTPSAPLVRSYGQSGRYWGNYLNWVYFHATDEQRAALPQQTLIMVAHDVISDIIDRTDRVRFGLTVFNGETGGNIRAGCGADKATLINSVRTTQATAWTPLGETMETILNYYRRTDAGAPIQAYCQKNFIVVVTDGMPTKDRNISAYLFDADGDGLDPGDCMSVGMHYNPGGWDCSHHFDDVAYHLFNNDMRPDLEGMQNVVTYTIGFNIDFPLLSLAAQKGDGLYLSAYNASELWHSLELVMLDIINRISAGSAVAVVSTERGDGDRLYRGKFMPGSWHGYLECFELPYEQGDAPQWEAGYLLMQRSASTRDIAVGLGGSLLGFTTGNAATLAGPMGLASVAAASDVIRWTRGEDVAGLRGRNNWKLGDIIHSTPVVVGAPANYIIEQDYQDFMDTHANRARMVYVGANDGMLHAFYAETGQEAWAFVPEYALPSLPAIADTAYCHRYTVDLTPSVRDCKIGGSWRTVLVGGGQQGGAGYFALDITTPNSPQLLWQAELPHGRSFGSEVTFATIDGQSVVLIGSGLDTVDGLAELNVYAVHDGALLGTVVLSSDSSRRNKATAATVVDLTFSGNHDVAYVADLQGHVWKLVFNGSTNPASWDRYCLWEGDEEITARPVAAFGPQGDEIFVYFGTGAYLVEDDIITDDDQIFGCVFDRHDGSQYASLVDQTDSHDASLSSRDGWYIELRQEPGERVPEPAAVVGGRIYFSSFAPSQEVCEAGGRSWLYRMDYQTGRLHEEDQGDDWNDDIVKELGQGVASRPVVDLVNENVIVQSSDAVIHVQDITGTVGSIRVRAWQEHFDNVSGL